MFVYETVTTPSVPDGEEFDLLHRNILPKEQ